MTRILSYNILIGGKGRVDQLTNIMSSAHPDIVGVIEATSPESIVEIADRLGMHHRISGIYTQGEDWQTALLSSLPIVETYIHSSDDKLGHPLLEVCLEERDGSKLTAFVTHLSANFYQGRAGDSIRRREIQAILRIMASKQGTPHLLMGDFNAIAPGDRLKASALIRYLNAMDLRRRKDRLDIFGHPNLDFVVPGPLRFLNPLLRVVPRSKALSNLFDWAGSLYAPRGSIGILRKAGYVDCFRLMNPNDSGFTCPAPAPAGRIDYIFASPELAVRLSSCSVITEGNGIRAEEASDHLPVLAEFGVNAERVERPAGGITTYRSFDSFDKV